MRSRLPRALALALAVAALAPLAAPSPALAIGLCEGRETTYELTHADLATGELLLTGEAEWCEENDEGEEVDGSIPFVLRIAADGERLEAWVVERPMKRVDETDPAEKRERLGQMLGVKKIGDAEALAALHEEGAFVPVWEEGDPQVKGPSVTPVAKLGECVIDAALREVDEPVNGFPMSELSLAAYKGDDEIVVAEIGPTARGENDALVVLERPDGTWLVFARTVECGGPPPGYFGEDDGGDCYAQYDVSVRTIEVEGAKALAACAP